MTNRNLDVTYRVIIEELMKECYTTSSIKEIMQRRYDIVLSKSGIKKIKKHNTDGLYKDEKHNGQPPKLLKKSQRIIRHMCLKNRAMS